MALSTYPELAEAIARWAWRTGEAEFEAAIPEFVALTENVLINGDASQGMAPLRVREMEQTDDITLTAGIGTLPVDFLEARAFRVGPDGCELPASAFTIVGNEIRIKDAPSHPGPVTIDYYAAIPALSQSSPTNWLIEKDHRVYLYGCLVQGAAFSREEGRMGYWGNLFISAVSGIAGSDARSRYSRSASRPTGPKP